MIRTPPCTGRPVFRTQYLSPDPRTAVSIWTKQSPMERAPELATRTTPRRASSDAATVTHAHPLFPHVEGKEFVDFDEDLTVRDIFDTIASGFEDIQLLKRFSTAGMGPSQGRHSSINVIRLAAIARAESEAEIGTTTLRPPYSGESFGVLAGRSFDPVRRTAMHHRHLQAGAQMMVAGAWLRPAYYGRPESAETAIAREVATVRINIGMIDVSTLGKFEIRGPDAAEFLNRIYVTGHLKQPVGRARYGLATDISGVVSDDGIVCRLAENHFFVTTTTSALETVIRSMYLWNARWQLDVDITNVSAAYAALNLAGPRSRDVLAQVCHDIQLDKELVPLHGRSHWPYCGSASACDAGRVCRRTWLRGPHPRELRRVCMGPTIGSRQNVGSACSAWRPSAFSAWRRDTSLSARTPTD